MLYFFIFIFSSQLLDELSHKMMLIYELYSELYTYVMDIFFYNGKSRVKAMRAFRGVSAALLNRFLSTEPKTFEQIEKYLDTACLHPTGRHWVYNFILPILFVHQFERAEKEGNMHLKQVTLERMLKYFFLAGHIHYA